MNEYELYGRMASAVKSLGGEVTESHYYSNGHMVVEGTMADGRKVTFWVEARKSGSES